MAQGGGDKGLRMVADDSGRAFASLPADQREFLDADVLEPLGAQIVGGPGCGLLFGGRLLPSALSGLLMGTLLYGLFDYLLDVPLPLGLFAAFVES